MAINNEKAVELAKRRYIEYKTRKEKDLEHLQQEKAQRKEQLETRETRHLLLPRTPTNGTFYDSQVMSSTSKRVVEQYRATSADGGRERLDPIAT